MSVPIDSEEQVTTIMNQPVAALKLIRYLLAIPINVQKMHKLCAEDIKMARFMERLGIDPGCDWRALSQAEVFANRKLKTDKPVEDEAVEIQKAAIDYASVRRDRGW